VDKFAVFLHFIKLLAYLFVMLNIIAFFFTIWWLLSETKVRLYRKRKTTSDNVADIRIRPPFEYIFFVTSATGCGYLAYKIIPAISTFFLTKLGIPS